MIKKMNYGNVENVTVVQFGLGTIGVVNSVGEKHRSILLRTNEEPKRIGEIGEKHKTSDGFNPEVAIVFHNEESFSIFEDFVKNIRKEFDEVQKFG